MPTSKFNKAVYRREAILQKSRFTLITVIFIRYTFDRRDKDHLNKTEQYSRFHSASWMCGYCGKKSFAAILFAKLFIACSDPK